MENSKLSGVVHVATNGDVVFLVEVKSGVWTVTKDGLVYGDYLKEEHAWESAQCAAAAIVAGGGAATVRLASTSAGGLAGPSVPADRVAVSCERPSRYPVPEARTTRSEVAKDTGDADGLPMA